jgi:hypothetical protein
MSSDGSVMRPVERDNAARNVGTLYCLINVLQRE